MHIVIHYRPWSWSFMASLVAVMVLGAIIGWFVTD